MEKFFNRYDEREFELIAGVEAFHSYEWDEIVVIRDLDTSELFWFDASGCSCNSIEDSIRDRKPVRSLADFTREARRWQAEADHEGDSGQIVAQVTNMISLTRKALTANRLKG